MFWSSLPPLCERFMDRKPKAKQLCVRERTPASVASQIISLFLAAMLQWATVLAVCPSLHELIHHDADDAHHDCAVTLFLGGQVEQPALDSIILAKPILLRIPLEPSYDSRFCGSFFLRCRPLEHAPPLRS
jgi:hypothetical protein